MRRRRKQRSEVLGMRLPADARDSLDREAERTGRFPAHIVADLIRLHLRPGEEAAGPVRQPSASVAPATP